ncbi:5'-nucleotidase C-terminal domain-containing protein [Cytophagaceae bacterium DM2B3-1]|uniref:5'-nucleotidase C-terminal domain-containing protein n=1 Tax=Xanthocytophaga flava TaxID=3048013 RepID=A0ABT7CVS9_9BACT|nr:5'-nucleotidase C-terminal domain-containing protein [Xanthocytophaga flavus]MDJ1496704.1 5'-nucleotidase C-terminal domain-containing protein [Xanthocytophaga flavus]
MKRYLVIFLFICTTGFLACKSSKSGSISRSADDNKIEVVFLQMNDVYEISPLEGGKTGGLSRVATIRKRLAAQNPNVRCIIAGDFLNPSVVGTLKYEGQRISGRQMVDVMNTAGVDLAIFGNHEFDLSESDLEKRLTESQFQWISSNAWHKTANGLTPFTSGSTQEPMPVTRILEFKDGDGTQVRVGMIGLVIDSNPKDFVQYDARYFNIARRLADSLESHCDYLVAITHLNIADDLELSKQVPGLRLIMGGHDHDHMYHQVGESFVAKADANAKTVYVHKLLYDKLQKKLTIQSQLVPVNATVPMDSTTQRVVDKWTTIADHSFNELGFSPNEVLLDTQELLDGRESSVRHHATNLTQLVTQSIAAAAPKADAVILNSGSIRIDDQLTGRITQYDILRALPFGGKILEVEMNGGLLKKILETGKGNEGSGGYLLYHQISYDESKKEWILKQRSIDSQKIYRIAISDFLLTGQEKNLDFLSSKNPDIKIVYTPEKNDPKDPHNDVRQAIIAYLRTNKK